MKDPLCLGKHGSTLDEKCRCNEYAAVRQDERKRLRRLAQQAYRQATPAKQGRMTAEQKGRVAAAQDFLIFITAEIGAR